MHQFKDASLLKTFRLRYHILIINDAAVKQKDKYKFCADATL
jgi:hypothetical protein